MIATFAEADLLQQRATPLHRLAAIPRVEAVAGLLSEMFSVGDGPPMFVFGWEF